MAESYGIHSDVDIDRSMVRNPDAVYFMGDSDRDAAIDREGISGKNYPAEIYCRSDLYSGDFTIFMGIILQSESIGNNRLLEGDGWIWKWGI